MAVAAIIWLVLVALILLFMRGANRPGAEIDFPEGANESKEWKQ